MKPINFSASLMMALIFLSGGLRAETWSLSECIDHALEHNISIEERKLEKELTHNRYQQNREDRYPTLSFSGGHNYDFGRTVDQFTNDFATEGVHSNRLNLNAEVTLFDGFRKRNTLDKNQTELRANEKATEDQKWQIRRDVMQAYLDVLLNKELLASREVQLERLTTEHDEIEKRVEAGDQAEADLIDLEAEKARQEREIVNAENQLEMAYLQLQQLLELPFDEEFEIEEPADNPQIDDSPEAVPHSREILAEAQESHPGLRERELNRRVAEKDIDIANANRYPTISLQGNLGSGYSGNRQEVLNQGELVGQEQIGFTSGGEEVIRPIYEPETQTVPYTDQIDNNINQSISISISYPIYDNRRSSYQEQEATLNKQLADKRYQQMEKQLLDEIQRARTDAIGAVKEFEAAQKAVEARQESFENTQQQMEAGMATPYRFNEAASRLQEAEFEMARAQYEYIFKREMLELFKGENPEM